MQRRWLFAGLLLALMVLPSLTGISAMVSLFKLPTAPSTSQAFTVVPFQVNGAVAQENAQPGTTSWELDPGVNSTFIQGYAGATSAQAGETVPLYISTIVPAEYSLSVYRIGWYGGQGGRLMLDVPHMHSIPQGFWTLKYGLVGCASCQIDPKTHLIDAHWSPSYQTHYSAQLAQWGVSHQTFGGAHRRIVHSLDRARRCLDRRRVAQYPP